MQADSSTDPPHTIAAARMLMGPFIDVDALGNNATEIMITPAIPAINATLPEEPFRCRSSVLTSAT